MKESTLLWAWRLAVLAALLWVGWQLREIDRGMPSEHDYSAELHDIRSAIEQLRR